MFETERVLVTRRPRSLTSMKRPKDRFPSAITSYSKLIRKGDHFNGNAASQPLEW